MEIIGTSSLYCEKYRPKTINDLILPDNFKKLFKKFVSDKDIPNLLFSSSAGRGKTSTAYAYKFIC
jgi:DNA polymerase III gamma/tau subunit